MPSNELITKTDNSVFDSRTNEMINSVVAKANLDRNTAREVYDFVKNEIDTMLNDYKMAKDIYDSMFNTIQAEESPQYKNVMLCKLGKPPRRPNIVNYIEQMNKALEMSIKSGDNIVNLLNIISKASTKKVQIDEVNIDNRSLILEEIIAAEKAEEEKLKEQTNG